MTAHYSSSNIRDHNCAAQDFWRTYCAPGTFRAFCKAVVSWASGKGFNFEFPAVAADGSSVAEVGTKSERDADNW